MNCYHNSENGAVSLSGPTIHLQLCRASGTIAWNTIIIEKRQYQSYWKKISLPDGLIPTELAALLQRSGGTDDFQLLQNYVCKNRSILEKIYDLSQTTAKEAEKNQYMHIKRIHF